MDTVSYCVGRSKAIVCATKGRHKTKNGIDWDARPFLWFLSFSFECLLWNLKITLHHPLCQI